MATGPAHIANGPRNTNVNIVMTERNLHVVDAPQVSAEMRERMNRAMAAIRESALSAAASVEGMAGAFSGLAHSVGVNPAEMVSLQSEAAIPDWEFTIDQGWINDFLALHSGAPNPVDSDVASCDIKPDALALQPSITKDAEEIKTYRRMTSIYRDKIVALEAEVRDQRVEIDELKMVLFRNGWDIPMRLVAGAARKLRLR